MILFIHGFGSCGSGEKAELLRAHFGADNFLAPDFPVDPRETAPQLEKLLAEYPISGLIGSSLGGLYATWLNRERLLPSVLINPAVLADEVLSRHLGWHRHWCTDEPFELRQEHVDFITGLRRETLRPEERYLVLLQTADEVLDYHDAERYYAGKDLLVEQGGDHRFRNLADYLPQIDAFFRHNEDPA